MLKCYPQHIYNELKYAPVRLLVLFLFVGYYPDGVKKVRDYEEGIYYRVEKGGIPVWDGQPGIPIDDIEHRIYERSMAADKAYRESFRMKKLKG